MGLRRRARQCPAARVARRHARRVRGDVPRRRGARATRGDAHALERGGANGAGDADASRMVKRFARTVVAGTEDAARVRTLDACERTVDHLFRALDDARRASTSASASASANALASANAFCEDRLRAVRQDLAMQGLFADDPVACGRCCALLERMIVRAVTSEAEREADASDDDFGAAALRERQLGKTFGMLLSAYAELGFDDDLHVERVGRFVSMLLCVRLRDGTSELAGDLRRVGVRTLATKDARFAMTCRAAFATGNWRRFFAIVDEASYEHACCLERHFAVARIDALRSLNCALNSTPMKLDELARVLRLDYASDAETYVKACGLTVNVDESAEPTVQFRTSPFTPPNLSRPDVAAALRAANRGFKSSSPAAPAIDRDVASVDVDVHLASLSLAR